MWAQNCFNWSLPNVIFLLISGTTRNSYSCFSLPILYLSEAHQSTSIVSPFTDWRNALHFFSFGFSFWDLYTLVWISDTSAAESNKTRNVCLFIFIMHEFGLPASSILHVGILLSNLLFPLAYTWFECTSFPGSGFVDLGSQSCL